ncbi:MAG: COX15/CtaA family protein [Bacteroidota bacterium]
MFKFSQHRSVLLWLSTGAFLIYTMVLVGGLTRLTHSGLSITDWSVMGTIPPLNQEQWNQRFLEYQKSPEFLKVNASMTVDAFKSIFWWEYIHRMIGRLLGYVFIIGAIILFIRRRIQAFMYPGLLLLFLLGALQGLIGWWMVYSGLISKPAVSHYRLATHFISALTLFSALLFIILKWKHNFKIKWHPLFKTHVFFMCVLLMQLIWGAFTAGYVSGNAAKIRPGHIFNTWPKMGEQWIADQVFEQPSLITNLIENASGIQFVHRCMAFVLALLILFLAWRSTKFNCNIYQKQGITALLYALTIQIMLGIFTLLYQVPLVLAALHQTTAFVLVGISVYLLYHFMYGAEAERK